MKKYKWMNENIEMILIGETAQNNEKIHYLEKEDDV